MGDGSSERAVSHVPLSTVLDSFPDAVVIVDAKSLEIADANAAAGTLFDCQPGALERRGLLACCPPAARDKVRALTERSRHTRADDGRGDTETVTIETVSGERRPVEITIQQITTGGDPLLFCLFRDVSERIDGEERLRSTVARLEALFEASPVPMAVLDASAVVERWNRAAESTFGWQAAEIAGEPYPLFESESTRDEVLERLHDGEMIAGMETTHQGRDGSIVDVELYAQPVVEDGGLTSIIVSAIDVTDLKQRERHLGVLHRILRHSLRNKLNVIHASGEHLAGKGSSRHADLLLEATDELIALSERAQRIDADLRRVESPTPVGLDALLRAVCEDVQRTYPDATVELRAVEPGIVVADVARTIVEELLDHAIRHSEPDRPVIKIDVAVDRRVAVTITAAHLGLTPGERAFLQRDEPAALLHGTRQSLAHADILATELGGQVTGEETEGGARLCVELPTRDGPVPDPRDAASRDLGVPEPDGD